MREQGVPGREFPRDRCPFVFQTLQITFSKVSHYFLLSPSLAALRDAAQRTCRDLPPIQAHFWAQNTSAHADARSEAPATSCPRRARQTARSSYPAAGSAPPTPLPPAGLWGGTLTSPFSRLFAPWFVAQPAPPPSRALSPHLSLPASEVLFSVGHRQNIPIIRFQRKECPPYLNHKTIKPRRLASSALLFCSAPFRIQRRETNSAIKVAFRGCGNVPIRCLPKWNNL